MRKTRVSVTTSETVTEVMVQIAEHQILIRMQILAEHNADGSDAGEAHPGAHFLHHVEAGAEGQPDQSAASSGSCGC